MKSFLLFVGVGLLTLGLLNNGSAASPENKSGSHKKRPKTPGHNKKTRRQQVAGRSFLSPSKMKKLGNGTHPVHTTHGHSVHATLRHGRLADMHLENKKGKMVRGRKVRQRRTAGLPASELYHASTDGQADVLTLAAEDSSADVVAVAAGGFQIAFVFMIQFNGQSIQLVFAFPTSSVFGGEEAPEEDGEPTDPAPSFPVRDCFILDNRFRSCEL